MLNDFKRGLFYKIPYLAKKRMPRIVLVEVTNSCMLRCPTCPTANAMKRPLGSMNLDTFSLLLSQISWKIDKLDFSYSGEPLLNKDIFRMIKMASDRNLPTGFDTNGMELVKYIEAVLTSGLKSITISIDGINQESASQFRKGVDFARVYEGILRLCKQRNKENKIYPQITLQFIIMKYNQNQIDKLEKFAKELGVDRIALKSLNLNMGFWLSEKEKQALAEKLLPTDTEYSRYSCDILPKSKKTNPCIFPLNDLIVLYNGDVILCCLDYNGRYILGNIFKMPLKDIWRSRLYDEYRKKVFNLELDICQDCDFTENLNRIVNLRYESC